MSTTINKQNKTSKVVVIGPSDTFDILLETYSGEICFEGYLGLESRQTFPYSTYKYLGSDEYIQTCDKSISMAIATYSNATRKKLFEFCFARQLNMIGATHPSAHVSSTAKIGVGCFIFPGSIVSTSAVVSSGVIVGYGALVGHDVSIDEFSFISPGVRLLGEAKIGSKVLIGANTVVLPKVRIGDNVKVSPGCVVYKDIPNNSIMMNVASNRIFGGGDESS